MTEAQVRALLELHAHPSADPALSADDVSAIVAGAKRADLEGRAPSETGWAETYAGAAAVAEAWEAKAAIAARRVDISRGGESVKRSGTLEACLRMARLWRGRAGGGSASGLSPALAARQALVGALPIGNLPEPEWPDVPAGGGGQTGYPGSDTWADGGEW